MGLRHTSSILFLVLILLTNNSPLFSQIEKKDFPNKAYSVLERFSGPIKIDSSIDQDIDNPSPLVIRSQDQFEHFINFLPTQGVTKDGFYGVNEDSLLKNPHFDWNKYMLLIVFDNQTLSFPPNISRIVVKNNQMTAVVEYADTKNLLEGKPMGIGAYGAALVVRTNGDLLWDFPDKKKTLHKTESPMIMATGMGGD